MKLILMVSVLLVGGAAHGWAQIPGNPSIPVTTFEVDPTQVSARRNARASAQAGDLATVQAEVARAAAARRSGRSPDIDTAEELVALTYSLDDGSDHDAALAISSMTRVVLGRLQRGKVTDEAVRAWLMEGALWERVHHDPAGARSAYRRVLDLNAANVEAREGLARLDLVEAMAAEKIREQELLFTSRKGPAAPVAQP